MKKKRNKMINDYYSENGEEESTTRLVANNAGINLAIFAPGITNSGEPYIITLKDLYKYDNNKTTDTRISMIRPIYLQYDQKLNDAEINWMISCLSLEWDRICESVEYYFINPESIWKKSNTMKPVSMPDYRQLR